MNGTPANESLPGSRLNALLRAVDWRFLLHQADRPRALDLTSGRLSDSLRLVSDRAESGSNADFVLIGFPTQNKLRKARSALRPGGEVVCLWRAPRIAGMRRARARLRRAGFGPASFHWAGPLPHRRPQFWLPLDSRSAIAHFLAQRPPRSRLAALARPIWQLCRRAGLLAPICAVAQHDEDRDRNRDGSEINALLGRDSAPILLTHGSMARNKVVCVPLKEDQEPTVVVKMARVAAADRSLEREEKVLIELAADRPDLHLSPRALSHGRRAGRHAVAQSAIPGSPPVPLDESDFSSLAPRVTQRLVELVGDTSPQPASEWHRNLVSDLIDEFDHHYGELLDPGAIDRARRALATLPDLPLTWEHRDCGVWNMHVTPSGTIAFVDWGGAKPGRLPGLDLAYFLATSTLVIEGAQMGDPQAFLESHRRLLDPSTPCGGVAARCVADYCEGLGIDREVFPLLRLRAWISMAVPDQPSFFKLAADEIHRLEEPADQGRTQPTMS